jgi:tetratricopeptide (TPR) repeat protein
LTKSLTVRSLATKCLISYILFGMNRVRLLLPCVFLLLSTTFPSCAVFDVIGSSLSRLYENSVSYFNAYYNAKRNFDEAEEMILAAERAARGKTKPDQHPAPPSGQARDKLNAVIDKCSSILSFYPKSDLVDDALFLIGKSYFYLQEYLKAERKFSELLTEFPLSDLALEGQLWWARTLTKINRAGDAQRVASALATKAVEQREYQLAAQAYVLLAKMAVEANLVREAIDWYSKAVQTGRDDFLVASALVELGDLHFARNDFEKAAASYAKAFDKVSDVYLNYYSRIQTARAYAALKRYDTAMYLTGEMLDNYRYAEYFPIIRLEHAHVLLKSGKTAEALDEYRFIDTTYQRTEAAANAAFTLGKFFELERADYPQARGYYARAAQYAGASFSAEARRRESGLGKLINLHRQLAIHDSLVALSDSLLKYPGRFVELSDSVGVDTTVAVTDTAEAKRMVPKTVFKPVDKDSIQIVNARLAYEIGETFHTELELPDSALLWFQRALEWKLDSTVAPRTHFILAQLGSSTATRTDKETAELYQTLIDRFPRSTYAEEARRILGLPLTQRTQEDGERVYAAAESLLWKGQYHRAIEGWKEIINENPSSALAAKSRYAIGWVYENYLLKPDSALAYYKMVAELHKTSPYAAAVKERITEAEKTESTPKQGQQPVQQEPAPKPAMEEEELLKPRPQIPREARKDTVKVRVVE